MSALEYLILVDENDQPLGECEKHEAHEKNLLHRAFSVFIFDDNRILMQRRQFTKYHCGGLWTNSCCGHPRPNEKTKAAAMRRLGEEMGFTQHLNYAGFFIYQADFDNGLSEHELDHVFWAEYSGADILPAVEEVSEFEWVSVDRLYEMLESQGQDYTPWLKPALKVVLEKRK